MHFKMCLKVLMSLFRAFYETPTWPVLEQAGKVSRRHKTIFFYLPHASSTTAMDHT
jgi:hypothetical protein